MKKIGDEKSRDTVPLMGHPSCSVIVSDYGDKPVANLLQGVRGISNSDIFCKWKNFVTDCHYPLILWQRVMITVESGNLLI
jgi:hypothetical protein